MSVLLLFVDGLGIGVREAERNPLARFPSRFLSLFANEPLPRLPYDGIVIPTRADMEVPGLPQSATGQTALFTGCNASRAVGHHISGMPTPTLRRLLAESSIFKFVQERGKRGVFANALSEEYFINRGEWISATTRALLAGNFPWLTMEDLRSGRAVSHDLTNEFLNQMGFAVPVRAVMESAAIIAQIAQNADFTLFEFVLTDTVGHSRDMALAQDIIARLDTLLEVVLSTLDRNETTVVLTSDHGNFEDMSVKTHTKNLVPTCVWGAGKRVLENVPELRIEEIAGYLQKMIS